MSTDSIVTTKRLSACEICGKQTEELMTVTSYNDEFCHLCYNCYLVRLKRKKEAILKCARCGKIEILNHPDVITAYYDMDDCIGDFEINYNVKIGHEYLVLCNKCTKDLKKFWKCGHEV